MKLKTERDLSYIDPLTVEFFQNNGTSGISVILLTNGRTEGWKEGRTDGQINGREFNTSLAEVIKYNKPASTITQLSVSSCQSPQSAPEWVGLADLSVACLSNYTHYFYIIFLPQICKSLLIVAKFNFCRI